MEELQKALTGENRTALQKKKEWVDVLKKLFDYIAQSVDNLAPQEQPIIKPQYMRKKAHEIQHAEPVESVVVDEEPGDVMAETLAKLYPDREAEKPEVVIEDSEADAKAEQTDASDNA